MVKFKFLKTPFSVPVGKPVLPKKPLRSVQTQTVKDMQPIDTTGRLHSLYELCADSVSHVSHFSGIKSYSILQCFGRNSNPWVDSSKLSSSYCEFGN